MANTIEDFLHALKRTINGDPYLQKNARVYAPISYRVAKIRDPLEDVLLAGRYRVKSRIGKGAMSVVYKAVQEPIDRVVAIKVLKREWSLDPVNVKRFNREAKTVSTLKHRNILSIHDVGSTDMGQPFFVMEFLDGVSLEYLVDNRGAVPIARAVPIFCQVCEGMAEAHKQGLIHRDLKPGNIMLISEDDGRELVKMVDFGIVQLSRDSQLSTQKLTKKGEVWGSPVYMSPEQCLGSELDARSDIYSLGIVMYETLLGVSAYSGKAAIGTIVNWQLTKMPLPFKEAAPTLRIPQRLEEIVFKALQKKPDDRYASMDALRQDLESFGKQHGIKMRNSMMIKLDPNLLSNPAELERAEPLEQVEDKTLRTNSVGSRTLGPNLNQERQTKFETIETSSPAPDKKTSSGSGPSTEQIKLLIAGAAVIMLLLITALIGIPIYLAVQHSSTSKQIAKPAKPVTVISVPQKSNPVLEKNSSPQTLDPIPNQDTKTETPAHDSEPLAPPSPDVQPDQNIGTKDNKETENLSLPPHQVVLKKAKVVKKQHKTAAGSSSNSGKAADDDSELERVYLKKHRGDETQQWMKIQQKMQGE